MSTSDPGPERVQKLLSRLGLASRREAEAWIRAGRLTLNGAQVTLGARVGAHDQLKLDGRPIRIRAAQREAVYICHRSPGEALLPERALAGARGSEPAAPTPTPARPRQRGRDALAAPALSMGERLPRRAGKRLISISPMPMVDGGLELLTADGALAAQLQRSVHGMEVEFSLRVRGELSEQQMQSISSGVLDRGVALRILTLEPAGGEGSNRWYRLVVQGASGNSVRQLVERSAATLVRMLRTRLGRLELPRTLPRGQARELTSEELAALLDTSGADR